MDPTSESRLTELHPLLAEKLRLLWGQLSADGVEVRVTQGFRNWKQQHALYLQGRAVLTDVNACRMRCGMAAIPQDQNRRVTKADAGFSWHCYGLAADVAPFRNGFPVWNEHDEVWSRIVNLGEQLGLRSGRSWGDEPHFELTGKFGPVPPDEIRQLYREANEFGSGSKAVWETAFGA